MLGISSRKNGIYGPFAVFQQPSFLNAANRLLRPDLLLLSASGHLIIIEVKLSSNPELHDRRILAQIMDYAATISSLTADEFSQPLCKRHDVVSWSELIFTLFKEQEDTDEIA